MNKLCLISFIFILFFSVLHGQSVVNTVHNLSVSGPGTVKAASESEVCIFCHTPHQSSPQKPLWNRNDPGTIYTLYGSGSPPFSSSTLQASVLNPNGSSILCLSCHDGSIALGEVLSRPTPIEFNSGITIMPTGNSNLSEDLRDDHPFSFLYNSTLYSSDAELADPASLTGDVTLEDEYLQCVSCHNPHNNDYTKFLVTSNQYSGLCITCHQKTEWDNSSHNLSNATWNGTEPNPWFHTEYITVSEGACENCHSPHNADGIPRLLNYALDENNCLVCHNGNVAARDIQSILSNPSNISLHNVYGYDGVHDPEENNIVQNLHVECQDCHNPHTVNNSSASAPDASGIISGVKGVNSTGNPVDQIQYQYELCYRCHSETSLMPVSPTTRQIEQNNVQFEFDEGNPSFHPIEGPGVNSNVPSLLSPYSVSSVIYCTDCHASSIDGSPAGLGPHGSEYPHILKYQYETTDGTIESAQNYELCYTCHDRNVILYTDNTFGERIHLRHIVEENTPCNVCHDPHGINSFQGNSDNNSNLINFDLSVVQASMSGTLYFQDTGEFSGICFLRCHGRNHGGWSIY